MLRSVDKEVALFRDSDLCLEQEGEIVMPDVRPLLKSTLDRIIDDCIDDILPLLEAELNSQNTREKKGSFEVMLQVHIKSLLLDYKTEVDIK